MKATGKILLLLLLAAWLSPLSDASARREAASPEVVEPFGLNVLVKDKNGPDSVHLGQFIGPDAKTPAKLLLLGFFASWCQPCLKEFPEIEAIHRDYAPRGLTVVMVNIDAEPKGIAAAETFVRGRSPAFPVLSDRFQIVSRRFFGERTDLPAVYLLDPDGRIRRKLVGDETAGGAAVRKAVRKVLGRPAESRPAEDRRAETRRAEDRRAEGPPPAEVRATVTKIDPRTVWLDRGKSAGVRRGWDCRAQSKKHGSGPCRIVRVSREAARIVSEIKLEAGDTVILRPPATGEEKKK